MQDKSNKPYLLGIDPGFYGALALIEPINRVIIAIYDMPTVQPLKIAGGPDAKYPIVVDGVQLVKIIKRHESTIKMAVLERVHAMPEQGVSSMFRFGEGYGLIQGVLHAFGIRTLMPPAAVWKAAHGLSHDKARSIALASNIFGQMATKQYFNRKKDDGRAEAALLALYGAGLPPAK